MNSWAASYLGSAIYGLLIFVGAAILGFVVAPLLGIASGFFPIEAEARGFFSLLTLKGVPYILALSVGSGIFYPALSGCRVSLRVALYCLNVVFVWLVAASIAFAILG